MDKKIKAKVLNEQETKDFWARLASPEYLKQRAEGFNGAIQLMQKESEMHKYCMENNCTIDDLINAHKKSQPSKTV